MASFYPTPRRETKRNRPSRGWCHKSDCFETGTHAAAFQHASLVFFTPFVVPALPRFLRRVPSNTHALPRAEKIS